MHTIGIHAAKHEDRINERKTKVIATKEIKKSYNDSESKSMQNLIRTFSRVRFRGIAKEYVQSGGD